MVVESRAGDPPGVEALVVVDAQRGFLSGAGAIPGAGELVAALAELVQRARRARAVIVHVQNDGPPEAVDEPGTSGWQLVLPVVESDHELVTRKQDDDSFAGTDIGEELARRGVRRIMVCGVLSEMCVSATVRGGLSRGFDVVIAQDAHGTFDLGNIPSHTVARVAEHALGDVPWIVPRAADVRFAHPDAPPPTTRRRRA
jgi:streptothricin hydrolase